MALTEKQIRLAGKIDRHVKEMLRTGGSDEDLLLCMPKHLGTFQQVMDSSSQAEMSELCERFEGFYRFGRLLIAQGITEGIIRVSK